MTNNNLSRKIFKQFVTTNQLTNCLVDNRNCLDLSGKIHGFSVFSDGFIECRQFYEDYEALIAVDAKTHEVFIVQRDKLNIDQAANRIQPRTGRKAYNAKCPIDVALKTAYKI